MLVSPPALNWTQAQLIGHRIVWTSEAYESFRHPFQPSSPSSISTMVWHKLPFERVQLDKFPLGPGLYTFTYEYPCLGCMPQELILYVGEARSLQARMRNHLTTKQAVHTSGSPHNHTPMTKDSDSYSLHSLISTSITVR